MKRIVLFSVVALLTAVVVLVFVIGASSEWAPCVLRSVDEKNYVARNEAVLQTVPIPTSYRKINSYSIGIPSPDACMPWHENGPPYSAFNTWHLYQGSGPAGGFYAHALQGKWKWVGGGASEATYERGLAVLYVSDTEDGFLLSMDYKGLAGRGH